MSILIGHAVGDENGKAHGGVAGDQKNEVCTRKWYNGNWSYVLRCKDPEKAEIMAKACEDGCVNKNVGYDQYQRNTLRKQAQIYGYDLSKIETPCECDCSSFVTVCAECAGIKIPYNDWNAPTTRTMLDAFTSTGMFETLLGMEYIASHLKLRRGDILVRPGNHTVMVLEDGPDAYPANCFPKYTGKSGSIVDALKAVGANSTFTYRTKIAKINNVKLYAGTAKQNLKLLALLKQGTLLKP